MQRRDFLTTTPLTVGLVTFGAASLFGCAKEGGIPPVVDEYKPLLRLAVSLGVDRVLTANPHAVPMAVSALTVTEDVLDRGEFTSAKTIGAVLRKHIPWEKMAADMRMLVEALIVAMTEEIRVLANRYQLPEDRKIALVVEVIGWAKDVALRHQAQPVKVQKVAVAF
jgi:hypothetical protein